MRCGLTSAKAFAVCAGLVALAGLTACGSPDAARTGAPAAQSPIAATADLDIAEPAEPVADAGEGTLCSASETSFFSCEIGTKRVSVCGNGTGAVYRYGTPGKIELSATELSYSREGFSGGGESQITATNADHSYTVFDRVVRTGFGPGGNEPAFSSGLLVRRGGRLLSSRTCSAVTPIDTEAEKLLPAGVLVEH